MTKRQQINREKIINKGGKTIDTLIKPEEKGQGIPR